MAFEWKLALETVKVSLRYVLAVGVTLGVVLFFPDHLINRLGLLTFRQQYQSCLGAAFVLFTAILCVDGFRALFKWAWEFYQKHSAIRESRARLKNLTAEEQELLRRYLEGQTKSLYLPIASGVVAGLKDTEIIYMSSQIGRAGGGMSFAHNIQTWAWDYLHDHPELIGLTPAVIASARAQSLDQKLPPSSG